MFTAASVVYRLSCKPVDKFYSLCEREWQHTSNYERFRIIHSRHHNTFHLKFLADLWITIARDYDVNTTNDCSKFFCRSLALVNAFCMLLLN